MFWRIVLRLITANRARLLVILVALAAGAAITAALLNLQIDAKSRLTSEFRSFGANVIITPKGPGNSGASAKSISIAVLDAVPNESDGKQVSKAAFLYEVAPVTPWANRNDAKLGPNAVVVGYKFRGRSFHDIIPGLAVVERAVPSEERNSCQVGEGAARKLRIAAGQRIVIGQHYTQDCFVSRVERFGGPEDDQVFAPLSLVSTINHPPPQSVTFTIFSAWKEETDRVSAIEVNVSGTPQSIEDYIAALQKQFPNFEIRGVRQFGEAQGKIYAKISGLLTATVVLVLILTALCVMASMTNVAMERRNDVGLMKAIGGATRRVLRLFLTEAALLGLAGGLIGAAVGMGLSIALGKAVFGMAARPRFIVYPISVGLTILVALASSYPLRRLASVRPAAVFRGEA